MKSRAFGAGWYIMRARLVSKMATMSRRREIESELRECERQLRMSMAGGAGLGAAYTTVPFPTTAPEGDVLTASEVSLYFVGTDGKRTQKKVTLTWANDNLQKGFGPADDPMKQLREFTAFSNWRYNLDGAFLTSTYTVDGTPGKDKAAYRFTIEGLEIQSLDPFGPNRIGFGKFNFKVASRVISNVMGTNAAGGSAVVGQELTTVHIPGVFLCRGNAVGILVVIEDDNKQKHTLLTVQPRIAAGRFAFPEIPAGMLDESTSFAGTAAKELKEETGIDLNMEDKPGKDGKTKTALAKIIDLTGSIYAGTNFSGVYPSAGGCDEMIQLFACELKMSNLNMTWLSGRLNGELHEGEMITLKIVPLENLAKEAPDMKALSALYLYERFKSTAAGSATTWYNVDTQIENKRITETGTKLAPLPRK